MSRPCLVCCHPQRGAIEALLSAGTSDRKVARQFNIERISLGRHRRHHVLKPAQDRLAILAKDTEERRQRRELSQAAAADAPSTQALVEATLGLRRQMEKLNAIEARLERMSAQAEAAASSAAVAQLAAQQFRGIETGARLADLTGFTPPVQTIGQPGAAPIFSVNILFSNGRSEEINVIETPATRNGPLEYDSAEDGIVNGIADEADYSGR
jgi:hypothetical protein